MDRVDMHLTWAVAFNDANRIEANFNEQHGPIAAHDHEFTEIVVAVRGSCRHYHARGEQSIGKGDAFLMRPGAWHAYDHCRNLTLYNCCFDPGILGRELGWMIDDPNLGRLLWSIPLSPGQHGMVTIHLPDSEFISSLRILDSLCALTRADVQAYRPDRVGLLVQLLGALGRHLPPVVNLPNPTKPHPSTLAALKLIDDDPTREWSLETLAAHVHANPDYLARTFRAVAGLPPMAYLRRRRLEMATSLLANSAHPVAEVGSRVGWPDASYFTRRFRTEFGLSPSAYRARFLQNRTASKLSNPGLGQSGL
jgi:AraC family transcriptional regulator, L-rhamnose operon transcriptional activator RhaR